MAIVGNEMAHQARPVSAGYVTPGSAPAPAPPALSSAKPSRRRVESAFLSLDQITVIRVFVLLLCTCRRSVIQVSYLLLLLWT